MIDLIKIVKTNDIKMLRDNLKFYNINIVDEKNNSLLHIAILNNNPEIVSFLVMNSINLNSQNEAGYTPLHFSILYNHFGIFKLLISQKADINLLDKNCETPLMLAMRLGRISMAKALLGLSANLDLVNKHGEGIEFYFLGLDNPNMLDEFIKNNPKRLYSKNYNQDTLLHIASKRGNLNLVKYLLENGCLPNIPNIDGETPLFLASRRGCYECAILLLDYMALLDLKNKFDETIEDIVPVSFYHDLKEYTMKPSYQNYLRNYPLHIAVIKNDLALILENNTIINKNKKDDYGRTPIDLAYAYNHPEIVKLLKNTKH